MKTKILIIEDHKDIIEIVEYHLGKEGYRVDSALTGEEGLNKIETDTPDLLLLDLMLPKMSGLEVCKALREKEATKRLPIIMLTAKGEEEDVVRGLEMGADDYIPKPFGNKELLARIKTVLRRTSASKELMTYKDLSVDVTRFIARVGTQDLPLTRAEFRLLHALMASQGRVLTRDQLIDKITGGDVMIVDRNIDVHVSSLRKKLETYGDRILTVRGVGYRFVE